MIDPRPLWDFDDPASSGERFLDAAERADEPDRTSWLTQYVRALGLQERYDAATRVLDGLASEIDARRASIETRSMSWVADRYLEILGVRADP